MIFFFRFKEQHTKKKHVLDHLGIIFESFGRPVRGRPTWVGSAGPARSAPRAEKSAEGGNNVCMYIYIYICLFVHMSYIVHLKKIKKYIFKKVMSLAIASLLAYLFVHYKYK